MDGSLHKAMTQGQADLETAEPFAQHLHNEYMQTYTKKDGKEYVKQHIPGQKNKHLGMRKDQGHRRD